MCARRIRSLMHNADFEGESIVWHREHRSKKGRNPKSNRTRMYSRRFKRKKQSLEERDQADW